MITGGFVLGEVLALCQSAFGLAVFLAVLSGTLCLCRKQERGLLYLLLPLFLIVGFFRMKGEQEGILEMDALNLDGTYGCAEGTVRSVTQKEDIVAVTLGKVKISHDEVSGALPLLLVNVRGSTCDLSELKIGNELLVKGRYHCFSPPRNPGQFDLRLYYLASKLRYSMVADSAEITGYRVRWFRQVLMDWSRHFSKVLVQITSPEEVGIWKAVILGDKSSMDRGIKDLYQDSGIAHLLAISGLHISIIGMGFYRMLRRCGLGYGAAGIICLAVIVSYGILSGESASAIRAVIMLLCQCLANYLGGTYDLVSAVSLAALLLLVDSPYHLLQGGFQLSFGAVLAIGTVGRYLLRVMETGNKVTDTVVVSISIQLVTYPLILYHFFQFPIYGILLNLIVIPFMAYVIYSGLLGIVLGSISLPLGIAAVGSGHYMLTCYLWLCRFFEKLPRHIVCFGRPSPVQLVCYGGIGGIGLFLLGKIKDKRKNAVLLMAMILCCFLILVPRKIGGLEVTFLDVGQGDGFVLRTERQTVLVDGGSSTEKELGRYCLEPFLKSKGVSHIDYAVVSHADQDHINGLMYLLTENTGIRIDAMLLPCLGKEDEAYDGLIEAAYRKQIQVHYMAGGDSLRLGGLTCHCLYPGWEDTASDRNDQSAMYLVSYGQFGMLLTGDMSREGEEKMMEKHENLNLVSKAQVLKAGHHGSRTATGESLLEETSFDWAVLSYGEGNSYGHPHKEVVERLDQAGITVWKTADCGAVTLETDGNRISWKTFLARPGCDNGKTVSGSNCVPCDPVI